MKRVYALYRVSTKGQVDKNDIPMQKNACRTFVDKMDNWQLCKEFYEKGVSGFKVSAEKRDAIQDLKLAAENNESRGRAAGEEKENSRQFGSQL